MSRYSDAYSTHLESFPVQVHTVAQAALALSFYGLFVMLEGRLGFLALGEGGSCLGAGLVQSPAMLLFAKIRVYVRRHLVAALETQFPGMAMGV